MEIEKLHMIMLGCTPKGRITEQHDIFFGIAPTLSELKTDLYDFWPEAERQLHIDAWQEVTQVDDYQIEVISRNEFKENPLKLFRYEVIAFFIISVQRYTSSFLTYQLSPT